MNALSIDATTDLLSLAVRHGERTADLALDAGLSHSERLVDTVDWLMKTLGMIPGDLDFIACASGPGSFTGLRIAISGAKGISLALGIPLILIPSLDAYALRHSAWPGTVVPLVDARKGRVYTALFSRGKRISDYLDIAFGNIMGKLPREERTLFTGPDAVLAGMCEFPGAEVDSFPRHSCSLELLSIAEDKFKRGEFAGNAEGPIYLRVSEAEMGITVKGTAGNET